MYHSGDGAGDDGGRNSDDSGDDGGGMDTH